MNENAKIIPIRDVEDWQVERLFCLPEYKARQNTRQRRHRVAKWAINAAIILALCAVCFAAGVCVAGL